MATKKAPRQDPLDALTDPAALQRVLQLILWKNRHNDPSMTAVIRAEDIQGLEDCCEYLKVTPEAVVVRPAGRPAQPAIPPRGDRPGIPAMPAEAPRPHVVVALVAKGTMDAIRPLENNDDDTEKLLAGQNLRKWREKAAMLAGNAQSMASGGDVSTATLQEIAQCLMAFAES